MPLARQHPRSLTRLKKNNTATLDEEWWVLDWSFSELWLRLLMLCAEIDPARIK